MREAQNNTYYGGDQYIPVGTVGRIAHRQKSGTRLIVDWHVSQVMEEFTTARAYVEWVETLDGRPVA
jgi:hypothetical protein